MNIIPFITKKVADPWTVQDEKDYSRYGSVDGYVMYIPSIHARLRLIEENMYLCNMRSNGIYKNFHLVPETRGSFYFIAYFPQINIVHQLKEVNILASELPRAAVLSQLLSHFDEYLKDGYDLSHDISIISEHIIIKVNAPIKDFFDIHNIGILNNEILDKYELLNCWYTNIFKEYVAIQQNDYIKNKFLNHNIKNIFKKIGFRLAIAGLFDIALEDTGIWENFQDGIDIMYDCDPDPITGSSYSFESVESQTMSNIDDEIAGNIGSDSYDSRDFGSNYGLDGGFNNISFGHAPNDGSYMKTSRTVVVQPAGGGEKHTLPVFLHYGDKYIDFHDKWVKLPWDNRFSLTGNDYIVK